MPLRLLSRDRPSGEEGGEELILMAATEIGKSVRRLDYETKVTGRAQYLADMNVWRSGAR